MACEMCHGSLKGAVLKSTEIIFQPNNLKSGKFEANTETAGYNTDLRFIAVKFINFTIS